MSFMITNSNLLMQRSIEYLWTNQSCILNNIANIETPGYKNQYVTFEDSLEKAIQNAAQKSKCTSSSFRQAIEDSAVEVHQADESARMDDNGVNITEQAVELARNGYQLQYVMDAISSDFSLLRTAIRG